MDAAFGGYFFIVDLMFWLQWQNVWYTRLKCYEVFKMKDKIQFKKYPRLNFVRKFGFVLICIGGLCFVFPGISSLNKWPGTKYELPLGDLRGVALDSAGNIYCGGQSYGRVQKYDPDGKFLSSFHVDSSGGSFRFRLNEKDELEIATARMARFIRYSLEGEIIEYKQGVDYIYKEFGPGTDKQCAGPGGITYRIADWSVLFPRVIKVSDSGDRSTVISVPIYKWIFMGPLPAWLFAVIGVLLVGFSETVAYKKEQKGSTMKDLEKINSAADHADFGSPFSRG